MLPASAGMIPSTNKLPPFTCGAPRIRGDDPFAGLYQGPKIKCSPHPRG